MKKKTKIIGICVVIAIVVAIVAVRSFKSNKAQAITIETAKVTKGKVCSSVTATGTIQAIKTVDVGTQVSGVISKIYVDYNSHVEKGELLAELDRQALESMLENAQANFENAQAEVNYQKANYNRTKALFDKNMISQADYDLAQYNYSKSLASLKTTTSDFNKAKVNLNYSYIYSPISGVILYRAVDEGQTVAASFSTPTLFTIANDLTQMQVEANIDEADIGQIKNGQKVTFTVDAFTDKSFAGEVTQIRLKPTTKSNVVTYTVIIKAPNPDMKLMPGMTANISIIQNEASDVLVIPSKALRFKPDMAVIADYEKLNGLKSEFQNETPQKINIKPNIPQTKRKVWVKNGKSIHPVDIEIGINDDANVQIISGLKEGDDIIFSMSAAKTETKEAAAKSPFMPTPPSKNKTH